MRITTLKRWISAVAVGFLLLLGGLSLTSLRVHHRVVAAEERLQRLSALAAEMRQSSEALTSLARDYVVTGTPVFRDRYFEVLGIRAGRRPRPTDYSVSDWWEERELPRGEPRSLLDMLRAEGVSEETFELLARSHAESEALAELEIETMARADELAVDDPPTSEREKLIATLHDADYHTSKQTIMRAARDFEAKVREAATSELEGLQSLQQSLLIAAFALIGAMILGALLIALYLHWAVLRPLESLSDSAERVAEGDYAARANINAPNELGFLARIFNQMASSIGSDIAHRQQVQCELERLANLDPLTALPNRRAFMEAARRELSRVRRSGDSAAVLMLDIDRFKRINDRYGHPTGDRVLRDLAQLLRLQIRDVDVAARLGGEEFAVVLSGSDEQSALHMAERLREAIAAHRVVGEDGGELRFTVSIGVAVLTPATDDIEDSLERADTALYAAKRGGRDRVAVWHEPEPPEPSEDWARLSSPSLAKP